MSSLIDLLKKTHHAEWEATPSWHDATAWLDSLIHFLFPSNHLPKKTSYEGILKKNQIDLENILLSYLDPKKIAIEQKVASFYDELETIYKNLRLDASKIYEYDPAATSVNEVIVSYPGFYAIAVYRIANYLSILQIPVLPRILTEYAHGKTGVDIHPEATIGVPFMIDHGTGIVIGATSVIGQNVSIYQGVTLGALQVAKELFNTKRHPTVGDNVIIYARTTILGGDTVIGENSVIGGSVFLTKSVAPNSQVFNTHQLRITVREGGAVG
ncbi:serine O-acetyltransferase [Dyadobacter fermentans]|uniref:Serine O-acetyltransferase n=1 Tax=Dyadobacter fermentans (strain ATCC 700827 / DSM 18053 / CIP 107007 / KCTC 52180 / NS114) TaxID=471854 RepID=C6VXB8_DYAFD|nr:serine O-acetyltransferase [Dyadobacter fermentans]ACT93261.1 Serine O-acetyltransferase [Dyadobacter fermentans DSM 18053]